jgi:hypothetical protein
MQARCRQRRQHIKPIEPRVCSPGAPAVAREATMMHRGFLANNDTEKYLLSARQHTPCRSKRRTLKIPTRRHLLLHAVPVLDNTLLGHSPVLPFRGLVHRLDVSVITDDIADAAA